MSSPTYWSQPNQQVVRDGDPVGIIDNGPDPEQAKAKAKAKGDDPAPADDTKKSKGSSSD